MSKKILVKGPFLSQSGYGIQSRFLLKALRSRQDLFDVYAINIPWGKTGWVTEESEQMSWLYNVMNKTHRYLQQNNQFDVSVQVTIPNEFEKLAPINIGYTAGIETDKISPQWIDKARLMDKIIVVSNHSKDTFNNTEYKIQNKQTGEVLDFRNTTPIDVIGFPVEQVDKTEINLDLSTDNNFLTVAQWGPRKNIETTLTSFFQEFKDEADVGLVLKINVTKNCIADKMSCERQLQNVKNTFPGAKCKIYLLHGNMTDSEMKSLYTNPKIKALVCTSHGEGFGLPLFEAAINGLPIVAPKWSGPVDFLQFPEKSSDGKVKMKNYFTPIDFELNIVAKEAVWDGVIQADSRWAYVKQSSVRESMRSVLKDRSNVLSKAKKLKEKLLVEFSESKQIDKMIECITGEKNVQIEDSEVPKISLITSMFKASKYLPQLLEDVVSQRLFSEKCEWIIMDANPLSDTTDYDILKPYLEKHPNIVYKHLESDPGIYDTWNMCIKESTGEFITNVNCDDRRMPRNIEKLAKMLVANPDVSLVYNDSYVVREPNINHLNVPNNCERYNFDQFSIEAMLRSNLPHNNPMWRKNIHEKHGYFNQKYKSAGDWDFWLRCAFGGETFKKHPEILGIYYFNPEGMSTNVENDSWKKEHEKEIYLNFLKLYQERMTKKAS